MRAKMTKILRKSFAYLTGIRYNGNAYPALQRNYMDELLQSMTSGRKLQMRKGVVAMVFSSLLFLFRFLPAVLILYFLAPRRWRNLVLLLFSLAFYAWGEPVYIILMLVSILVSYTGGILVDRFYAAGDAPDRRAWH